MQTMETVGQQNAAPLDAAEAARILGMNSRTLVRWAPCGYVPAHPLGEGKRRIWRFFESELLEWVEEQRNGCIRGLPHDKLTPAIGAHAKEIA
jgi:hypothetical protein